MDEALEPDGVLWPLLNADSELCIWKDRAWSRNNDIKDLFHLSVWLNITSSEKPSLINLLKLGTPCQFSITVPHLCVFSIHSICYSFTFLKAWFLFLFFVHLQFLLVSYHVLYI